MEDFKKYTILVVDDDQDLREAIVFEFKRKGFTVLSADGGSRAFEQVTENKVHLVISDMTMPGGDGMSLLKNIREYDPTIPIVIFITGYSDVSEKQAIEQGALKMLSKPFDSKVLMDSALGALGLFTAIKVS